ncbi:MAG: extracellular solute-binding protein family 1 [Paenibacillus sp.]|nr:extracellular solute-binding protein family 1 [Paenibacillus sp.]
MIKRNIMLALSLLATMISQAACSGGKSEPAGKETSAAPEPVELTFYYGGAYGQETFMRNYGSYLNKKFPHFTLKFLENTKGSSLPEVLAQKTDIDILYTSILNVKTDIFDNGLEYDMSELIKKHKYDMSLLEPGLVDLLKYANGRASDGKMYTLPVGMDPGKFVYNKDLFDKFGVAYPKDGLTWNQVYELAKTMTRQDGGVQYRGLVLDFNLLTMNNQLSAGFVDSKTGKTLLSDNRWPKILTQFIRFYQIPGNELNEKSVGWATQRNYFIADTTAAMMLTYNSLNPTWKGNWDLAKFPVWDDMPGVGPQPIPNAFTVTGISKHKDAAFQAIAYLTSKEYQAAMAKDGIVLPVLKDQEVKKAYGQNVDFLKGKNLQALYADQYAKPYELTPYDGVARGKLVEQMNQVALKTADINTALRVAAEAADKEIEKQKSGK